MPLLPSPSPAPSFSSSFYLSSHIPPQPSFSFSYSLLLISIQSFFSYSSAAFAYSLEKPSPTFRSIHPTFTCPSPTSSPPPLQVLTSQQANQPNPRNVQTTVLFCKFIVRLCFSLETAYKHGSSNGTNFSSHICPNVILPSAFVLKQD